MSDWQLLDDGSWNGLRKWIKSGDEEDSVQVAYDQINLKDYLDDNKRAQSDFSKSGDMWHAASIPPIVMHEWVIKHGVRAWDPNHADGVKRLLNSSEYAYLKRAPITL